MAKKPKTLNAYRASLLGRGLITHAEAVLMIGADKGGVWFDAPNGYRYIPMREIYARRDTVRAMVARRTA